METGEPRSGGAFPCKGANEARRSRTDRAWGCHAAPVLKAFCGVTWRNPRFAGEALHQEAVRASLRAGPQARAISTPTTQLPDGRLRRQGGRGTCGSRARPRRGPRSSEPTRRRGSPARARSAQARSEVSANDGNGKSCELRFPGFDVPVGVTASSGFPSAVSACARAMRRRRSRSRVARTPWAGR